MALAVPTASAVAQAIAPEDAPLQGFLIARSQGKKIEIEDFEKTIYPETLDETMKVFLRYSETITATEFGK